MILQIEQLSKSFPHPGSKEPVHVLSKLNLAVGDGETAAIVGQSGSGKSTLLSLMAGLDRPTEGTLRLRGENLPELSEEALTRFRAKNIGIVFQQFHLMAHLTALENVALPLEMARSRNAQSRAKTALEQVGLSHRETHFPHQLSGGECQRVAISRALVIEPALLLADEPTGNLDQQTGEQVSDLLFDLVSGQGMTLVLVTHNQELARRCTRQHTLQAGALH